MTRLTAFDRRPWAGVTLIALSVALMAGFAPSAIAATGPTGGPPSGRSGERVIRNRGPFAAAPGEMAGAANALPPGTRMVDTVVSNTDPSLKNTDTFPNGEPAIAVDPANPQRVVITAFSSCWQNVCGSGNNAALWTSQNGGAIWTKSFSVPPPPNGVVGSGCPCDQTPDYGRSSSLYGTFLSVPNTGPAEIYTGSTSNPTSSWNWQTTAGTANPTNAAGTNGDQPWLLVNRDPATGAQDDVYVGYDDFAVSPPVEHVAAAPAPLGGTFSVDQVVGSSSNCCINPGLRLAMDHTTGAVYALWQQATFTAGGSPEITIQYMLNRSTDGGHIWSLNGSATGVQIASVPSDQIYDSYTAAHYKFGTVNALFGGIDHATVDPTTGDVYYVYGQRDATTGKNRLAIVRLRKNNTGGLTAGAPRFVTGQVQAALPSVAVATSGEIGVLYDTYDRTDANGFPVFSVHLSRSSNHGSSFTDANLLTFSSPFKDNGNTRQRVLGDYQQLKAVGMMFYAAFTANGSVFGRPFGNPDPIFASVPADPIVKSISPKAAAHGTSRTVTVRGAGFLPGATVGFSGTGITVGGTTVMPTSITASITIASNATVSKRTAIVSNPGGGTGQCKNCFSVT